jgi:hypothetical protein
MCKLTMTHAQKKCMFDRHRGSFSHVSWFEAAHSGYKLLIASQVLKQKALRSSEQQPCLQQFQASEISDLPPRIRALFEDNRVCHGTNSTTLPAQL